MTASPESWPLPPQQVLLHRPRVDEVLQPRVAPLARIPDADCRSSRMASPTDPPAPTVQGTPALRLLGDQLMMVGPPGAPTIFGVAPIGRCRRAPSTAGAGHPDEVAAPSTTTVLARYGPSGAYICAIGRPTSARAPKPIHVRCRRDDVVRFVMRRSSPASVSGCAPISWAKARPSSDSPIGRKAGRACLRPSACRKSSSLNVGLHGSPPVVRNRSESEQPRDHGIEVAPVVDIGARHGVQQA